MSTLTSAPAAAPGTCAELRFEAETCQDARGYALVARGYAVVDDDQLLGYVFRAPLNPRLWNAYTDLERLDIVAQRSTRQLAGAALRWHHRIKNQPPQCWVLHTGGPCLMSETPVEPVAVVVGSCDQARREALRLNRDNREHGHVGAAEHVRVHPQAIPVVTIGGDR
jgi:hypothetical protein